MTTNKYVIKTLKEGVKVVIINDLKSYQSSLKHFLDAEGNWSYRDSLKLKITDYHITVAATHNELMYNFKFRVP
jgi:hypothetical protein